MAIPDPAHIPPDRSNSNATPSASLASTSSNNPKTSPAPSVKPATKSTFASVFTSTFLTILFAEMGDKTQLTTLLMTAESQKPLIVFLGAGSALVTTSLLGVLLGRWLANRVSEEAIETAAGIALMVIAVLLIGDMMDMT